LLDPFAQGFVIRRLQIYCIYARASPPRLVQKSGAQLHPSQLNGYGLGEEAAEAFGFADAGDAEA
jgi:hypothetical protein